jgi:hypothetical protein
VPIFTWPVLCEYRDRDSNHDGHESKNEGKMSKLNVVDLGAFKEIKELKKSVISFEKYLKGLSNIQLEVEVNHLLDENQGKDFFSKSQAILKEITSRVHPAVKPKIEELRLEK